MCETGMSPLGFFYGPAAYDIESLDTTVFSSPNLEPIATYLQQERGAATAALTTCGAAVSASGPSATCTLGSTPYSAAEVVKISTVLIKVAVYLQTQWTKPVGPPRAPCLRAHAHPAPAALQHALACASVAALAPRLRVHGGTAATFTTITTIIPTTATTATINTTAATTTITITPASASTPSHPQNIHRPSPLPCGLVRANPSPSPSPNPNPNPSPSPNPNPLPAPRSPAAFSMLPRPRSSSDR